MSNTYYSKRLRAKDTKKLRNKRKTSRPKSFKTVEAANKWATEKKISKYVLKNLRIPGKTKKIVIVQ